MRTQHTFNPIDYHWAWTEDWYQWDEKQARAAAIKARNALAKELTANGYQVRKYTHPNQLISRGGIGSGHPHIQLYVNVYCVDIVGAR